MLCMFLHQCPLVGMLHHLLWICCGNVHEEPIDMVHCEVLSIKCPHLHLFSGSRQAMKVFLTKHKTRLLHEEHFSLEIPVSSKSLSLHSTARLRCLAAAWESEQSKHAMQKWQKFVISDDDDDDDEDYQPSAAHRPAAASRQTSDAVQVP